MPASVANFRTSVVGLKTRVRRFISNRGLSDSIAFLWQRFVIPRCGLVLAHRVRSGIEKRPAFASGAATVIVKSTLDYSFPYWQRPHHLARAFCRQGLNVIFVTPSAGYDRVSSVRDLYPGFLLTPDFNAAMDVIDRPIVYTLSTDASLNATLIQDVRRKRGQVIYDYIDAMDSHISSGPLSEERLELHRKLLRETDSCLCVATSLELFREVTRYRKQHAALVENGVELADFNVERCLSSLGEDMHEIVLQGRPIAGYFGTLASWLDYSLIVTAATALPEWNFVLIGINYDGSCAALSDGPRNIYILPAIPYKKLPATAVWFDVALIPFKINEITNATSPLKLFEYMALGLPVISTSIPESSRYKSVCVAADERSFVQGIGMAYQQRSRDACRRRLREEAARNSWDAKALKILRLLDQIRPGVEASLPISSTSTNRV